MMDDERLDLSPLDPMRDPGRWRGVMGGTLARVDAVLAARLRRPDPLATIAGWARPLLAAAAAAVALLVPVELALEAREAREGRVEALVSLSTDWASGARRPTGADVLRALDTGGGR